jgi:hypothetical protein
MVKLANKNRIVMVSNGLWLLYAFMEKLHAFTQEILRHPARRNANARCFANFSG